VQVSSDVMLRSEVLNRRFVSASRSRASRGRRGSLKVHKFIPDDSCGQLGHNTSGCVDILSTHRKVIIDPTSLWLSRIYLRLRASANVALR
jgi:hypothetical protein